MVKGFKVKRGKEMAEDKVQEAEQTGEAAEGEDDASMEEILSSIRKIITEDGEEQPEGEEAKELSQEEIDALAAGAAPEAEEPEAAEEESAELTQEQIDALSAEAAAGDDEPAEAEDADVLELTGPIAEEQSEEAAELSQEEIDALAAGATEEVAEEEPPIVEEEPVAEVAPEPIPEPVVDEVPEEPLPDLDPEEDLIQGKTAEITQSVILDLKAQVEDITSKMPVGRTTLDDIVKDVLRPLLKRWMDENLTDIVERIAREEIERVVDRTMK